MRDHVMWLFAAHYPAAFSSTRLLDDLRVWAAAKNEEEKANG